MLELKRIPEAIKYEGGVSRRLFIGYMASLAAIPLLGQQATLGQDGPRASFSADPFTLGVASGDPDANSVVLWTKLAPRLDLPDGGMGDQAVSVTNGHTWLEALRR